MSNNLTVETQPFQIENITTFSESDFKHYPIAAGETVLVIEVEHFDHEQRTSAEQAERHTVQHAIPASGKYADLFWSERLEDGQLKVIGIGRCVCSNAGIGMLIAWRPFMGATERHHWPAPPRSDW